MSKTIIVAGSLLLAGAFLTSTGCTPTVSQAQRSNITQRMTGAQIPLAKCYADLLSTTPAAAGNVAVAFRIQPNTGRFTNVKMNRTQINDPAFNKCVLAVVSDLHMSPAPSFIIDVVEYPIGFKPVTAK
ncbi:MAG: AgmX/PglI C-terminal domain-containing protein [Deltaproteobacteria bacterium]|nr:AgmX/PglI C-terminal domain-containing protein [Deltaproteobacteria bacterium]